MRFILLALSLASVTLQAQTSNSVTVSKESRSLEGIVRSSAKASFHDGTTVYPPPPDAASNGAPDVSFSVNEARKLLEKDLLSRRKDEPSGRLVRWWGVIGFHGLTRWIPSLRGDEGYARVDAKSSAPVVSPYVRRAIQMLSTAATHEDPDALFLLGEFSLYGNYSLPRNLTAAFSHFSTLASLTGNASAHYMLGFMHSTGLGNVVPRDQAKALLHHQLAADGGDVRSGMTLAYRHHTGLGVPVNCEKACYYYRGAARRAVEYSRSGPPGGQTLVRQSYRLADEVGGVYGVGASVSSASITTVDRKGRQSFQESLDDVMEYLDLISRKGDAAATLSLGRYNYDGSHQFKRDYRKARSYFMSVARERWSKDGSILPDSDGIERIAAQAAGFLGRIYLRGEGVERDLGRAVTWLRRGVQHGDMMAQHSLGVAYLEGLGVTQDTVKAVDLFKAAGQQGLGISHAFLGRLLLDQGDIDSAANYFDFAASIGQIEGLYNLAQIHDQDLIQPRSCHLATVYYKLTAEKVEHLQTSILEANEAYDNGDIPLAFLGYLMAAEQGFEHSQQNVAYLLDHHARLLSISRLGESSHPDLSAIQGGTKANDFWARSAKQSNHDSALKVGDSMLQRKDHSFDPAKAAAVYEAASDKSAQALWNLGWMHENGIGVEQDFHLAKRNYDLSLELSKDAFLPVTLALAKLRMRSAFNTLVSGHVRSIDGDHSAETKWSMSSWLAQRLYFGERGAVASLIDLRKQGTEVKTDETDLSDDAALDLLETLMIVSLVGFLSFLLYYRGRLQNRVVVQQQNH